MAISVRLPVGALVHAPGTAVKLAGRPITFPRSGCERRHCMRKRDGLSLPSFPSLTRRSEGPLTAALRSANYGPDTSRYKRQFVQRIA